jgi:hypothetical protein
MRLQQRIDFGVGVGVLGAVNLQVGLLKKQVLGTVNLHVGLFKKQVLGAVNLQVGLLRSRCLGLSICMWVC